MIGEDPSRPGLVDTPKRMANALLACTSGYGVPVEDEVRDALFDVESNDLVVVKDIDVFSMCEHHMLPFFGKVGGSVVWPVSMSPLLLSQHVGGEQVTCCRSHGRVNFTGTR